MLSVISDWQQGGVIGVLLPAVLACGGSQLGACLVQRPRRHIPFSCAFALACFFPLLMALSVSATDAAAPGQAASSPQPYFQQGWSGELRLRVDGYAGTLPIPDDGVSDVIQDIRRRELPAEGTRIGIRQMTRLRWEVAPTRSSWLRLTLRNYGFWGVGYYTSGTYGVRSFTADPFSIEELSVRFPLGRGMLSLGSQYFQLGPVGLLAATPLSEAEGVSLPLGLGIWESVTEGRALSLLLGRVSTEFDDESGLAVDADDYAALRLGIAGEHSFSGLNLLFSGRDQEQGVSWDWTGDSGSRLEIAVARASPASPWQLAGYGEWVVRPAGGWAVQLGYAPPGYPIGYAQLANLGGSLALSTGETLVGVTVRRPAAAPGDRPLAGTWTGSVRAYGTPAQGLSGEARLGWEGELWPAVMLKAEWTQWALAAGGYGRGRVELVYRF